MWWHQVKMSLCLGHCVSKHGCTFYLNYTNRVQAFNIVSNILIFSVMPGGDFDGQMDYLEQFGSSTVSVSIMSLYKPICYFIRNGYSIWCIISLLRNISDFQWFTKTLFCFSLRSRLCGNSHCIWSLTRCWRRVLRKLEWTAVTLDSACLGPLLPSGQLVFSTNSFK